MKRSHVLRLCPLLFAVVGLAVSRPVQAQPVAKVSFLPVGSFSLPSSGGGALDRPRVVAWAPSNQIHIGDERGLIAVFDSAGGFVRSYGSGALERVSALAIDTLGRAYVLDSKRKNVLVFDEVGEVLHRIGGVGKGAGRLEEPEDLAMGPGGRVYVLDRRRKGVQVFSLDGTFIHEVALPLEVKEPRALGVGPSGQIYVVDKKVGNGIIRLPSLKEGFSARGGPVQLNGVRIRGGNLRDPIAVVTTPTGGVIVGDRETGLLWYADATGTQPAGSDDRLYGGRGSGRGSFRKLEDAALVGTDEMVFLDGDGRKVERVRLVLEPQRTIVEIMDYPIQVQRVELNLDPGVLATVARTAGTTWLAVADREGRNLRVVEARMMERAGVFGDRIRVPEPLPSSPAHAFGQVVERAGGVALNDTLLVVAEPRKNRVHVFDLRTNALIGTFGDNYSDDRRLRNPQGVALFPDGRIAVADRGNDRIAVFSADIASLLGTFLLLKAQGVVISPQGRMFVWNQDGTQAGELPLEGGSIVRLPGVLSSSAVGALSVDEAGNVYGLLKGSGRVVIANNQIDRLLARVGAQSDLEKGGHLAVDSDGNIYATDVSKGRTVVSRWGVEVPPVGALMATWTPGQADVRWDPVGSSFVPGYLIEGAVSPEGPWSKVGTVDESHALVASADLTHYRVSARTLTGATGQPSPAVPVFHLVVAAAVEAGEWDRARSLARQALDLTRRGEASASEEVLNTLAWHGFVSAHEATDYTDVLVWRDLLGDGFLRQRRLDGAFRLADTHQHLGDLSAATDWAKQGLRLASASPSDASEERLAALRGIIFDNGSALGLWEDVASVGQELLQAAGPAPDPSLVERVARASLATGASERAMELVQAALDGSVPEDFRQRFVILAFMIAETRADYPGALAYAAEVGESLPVDLFVDFETTLARVHLQSDEVEIARSGLLFLLGEAGYAESLARSDVANTVLATYSALLEQGNPIGGMALLDSVTSSLPAEFMDVRSEILAQADSISAVADTNWKLGEGFKFFRDALFRDALRFFQEAAARTDLDVDQHLIAREIQAAVFHSLARMEDADKVYRDVFELDPDFRLDEHLAHVEATYGLTIFSPEMLAHFREIGPIM